MKTCRIDKSCRYLSLLLSLIVAALCGCSALQRTQMPLRSEMVPAGFELVGVPFYPQTAYQCGPATLAMALTYRGLSITPEELRSQVYTPDLKGSLQMDIVPLVESGKSVGWLELYSFPLLDTKENPSGIVEYVRNITERIEAEQAVRDPAFSHWGRANGACLGQQVTTMKCKRATWS